MALKSNLFKGSRGLAACEIDHAAHFTIGKEGDDVGRIQMALLAIDSLKIERQELLSKTYGQSTATAVLAFKTKRKIINYSYQNKPEVQPTPNMLWITAVLSYRSTSRRPRWGQSGS